MRNAGCYYLEEDQSNVEFHYLGSAHLVSISQCTYPPMTEMCFTIICLRNTQKECCTWDKRCWFFIYHFTIHVRSQRTWVTWEGKKCQIFCMCVGISTTVVLNKNWFFYFISQIPNSSWRKWIFLAFVPQCYIQWNDSWSTHHTYLRKQQEHSDDDTVLRNEGFLFTLGETTLQHIVGN